MGEFRIILYLNLNPVTAPEPDTWIFSGINIWLVYMGEIKIPVNIES